LKKNIIENLKTLPHRVSIFFFTTTGQLKFIKNHSL